VSRVLLDLLRETADREVIPDTDEEPTRIPPRRWSRVFSRYGGLILRRIARHLGYDPPEENLLELLLAASIDPNPHRPSLIEDVRHGAFVRELACNTISRNFPQRRATAAGEDSALNG